MNTANRIIEIGDRIRLLALEIAEDGNAANLVVHRVLTRRMQNDPELRRLWSDVDLCAEIGLALPRGPERLRFGTDVPHEAKRSELRVNSESRRTYTR